MITISSLLVLCIGLVRLWEGSLALYHEGLGYWDLSCGAVAIIAGSLGLIRDKLSKKNRLISKLPWGWDFVLIALMAIVIVMYMVDLLFF